LAGDARDADANGVTKNDSNDQHLLEGELESLASNLRAHLAAAEQGAEKCLAALRASGVIEVTEEHLVQERLLVFVVIIIINIIILNTLILVTIITTTTIIIITINIFAKNCIRLRLLSFVSSFARAHHGIVHDDIGLRADRSITPQIGHQTGSPGSCRKLKELQGDIICIF
jgi:hypothetical protein